MNSRLPNSRWWRTRRGFTLVELMIAVGIIAILASFLAPSVTRYVRRSGGLSAARDVANTLRQARSLAMSHGEPVLAEITMQANGANGTVQLFRSQGDVLSCAQTAAFNRTAIPQPQVDFAQTAPDMVISGFDAAPAPAGNTLTLCFSPSGRVLNTSGTSFTSECDAINTRIFVVEGQPGDGGLHQNPFGSGEPELDSCLDVANDDAATRQSQKDGRDVANFFSIHVPYNGAISVIQ